MKMTSFEDGDTHGDLPTNALKVIEGT